MPAMITLVLLLALLLWLAMWTDEHWNWVGRLACWQRRGHLPARIGYETYCQCCHARLLPRGGAQ